MVSQADLDRLYGNLDATPEAQDWIKAGKWDLPTDTDIFVEAIVHSNPAEWEHFKTLPVYRAMPAGLARSVERRFHPDAKAKAADDRRSSLRDGGR